MIEPTIVRISESAFTLNWESVIDPTIHKYVVEADTLISLNPFPGWIENVPAFHTLTVFFDVRIAQHYEIDNNYFFLYIKNVLSKEHSLYHTPKPLITIPVLYHPSVAPDLEWATNCLQMDIDTLIQIHSNQIYTVFLIGFMPGFPYMGILPDALVLPRKNTPATQVPAGTVAIAGKQTGIYPHNSPGGWYGIGQTPLPLFSNGKSLLQSGDQVKFIPIKE